MGYLQTILILSCVSAVAALGLAVLTGYAGLYSLGHAGFMALGAYTAALAVRQGVPFILALPAGGALAAVASLIIGYPALRGRLRGDYFAIVTLGFGEVVRLLLNNSPPALGGAIGLTNLPMRTTPALALGVTIAAFWGAHNLAHSHWGRCLCACRMDPLAARSVGIDVRRARLTALAFSAFYAGVAGALLAGHLGYLSPAMFTLARSTELLAAVVLGGVQSLLGPLLAAAALTAVPELLRFASSWRLVLYGALLVLTMLWRPQGLLGYFDPPLPNLAALFKQSNKRDPS